MIFVRLELLCVHYRTSRCGGGSLTFTSRFRRFTYALFAYLFLPFFLLIAGIIFTILHAFSKPSPFLLHQDNPSDKDLNQGTLVVFNLDPSVSNEDLRQIFGAYGEVKEVIFFPYLQKARVWDYMLDICTLRYLFASTDKGNSS